MQYVKCISRETTRTTQHNSYIQNDMCGNYKWKKKTTTNWLPSANGLEFVVFSRFPASNLITKCSVECRENWYNLHSYKNGTMTCQGEKTPNKSSTCQKFNLSHLDHGSESMLIAALRQEICKESASLCIDKSPDVFWLVVSTRLKNISQNGIFPK